MVDLDAVESHLCKVALLVAVFLSSARLLGELCCYHLAGEEEVFIANAMNVLVTVDGAVASATETTACECQSLLDEDPPKCQRD